MAEAAPLSNPAFTVPAALWLLGLGPAALAALAGLAGLGLQLVRDEEGGKLVPQRLHADTAAGWSTSHCRLEHTGRRVEHTGRRVGLFRLWNTLQPPGVCRGLGRLRAARFSRYLSIHRAGCLPLRALQRPLERGGVLLAGLREPHAAHVRVSLRVWVQCGWVGTRVTGPCDTSAVGWGGQTCVSPCEASHE